MSILVIRAEGTPDADVVALRGRGLHVEADPYLTVAPCSDPDTATRAGEVLAALAQKGAWLVLTSAAGVRALRALSSPDALGKVVARARCAAVGPTSAAALTALGAPSVLVPSTPTAAGLLDRLRAVEPTVAALPRSTIADPLLPDALRARGWTVIDRALYRTATVDQRPRTVARVGAGEFAAIVVRSPSAARALVHHAQVPTETAIIAGGPTTALAAQRLGLPVRAVSASATAEGIADAVQRALAPS